jgi:hypothetical protein
MLAPVSSDSNGRANDDTRADAALNIQHKRAVLYSLEQLPINTAVLNPVLVELELAKVLKSSHSVCSHQVSFPSPFTLLVTFAVSSTRRRCRHLARRRHHPV